MNYADDLATAQEMIAEFGRDILLLTKNTDTYDPQADNDVTGSPTQRTVKAVFTAYSDKEIDGDIIKRGDKKCLIAVAVDGNEILKDGADEYSIVNKQEVQPGDTLVLTKLQVRR